MNLRTKGEKEVGCKSILLLLRNIGVSQIVDNYKFVFIGIVSLPVEIKIARQIT